MGKEVKDGAEADSIAPSVAPSVTAGAKTNLLFYCCDIYNLKRFSSQSEVTSVDLINIHPRRTLLPNEPSVETLSQSAI